jgi:hypothetical protein
MKFADAAARDAALGTAVASGNALREGMVAYLDDEDLPSFYNGTSWTTEFGGGGLVAVKHAIKTDTQSSSLGAAAEIAISGLSITHAVSNAAHKVLLLVNIVGTIGFGNRSLGIRLKADSTAIGVGGADGSRPQITTAGGIDGASENTFTASSAVLYAPVSTSSIVYTANIVNLQDGTAVNYINRTVNDTNNARGGRPVSTLTLLEVKA